MVCPRCQTQVPDSFRYCPQCGQSTLPSSPPAPSEEMAASAESAATQAVAPADAGGPVGATVDLPEGPTESGEDSPVPAGSETSPSGSEKDAVRTLLSQANLYRLRGL